ncbi:hypothetical protein [Ruegeria sp. Ofav3-42]|uniref:hypothetical protein n=1 Tax=Ruegeria sp. Ofav3-42 TaxID=2917759 RepID=UPI001EF3EA07|nr:hypothetical protein [Ruegeria sp. Ofav3-42]MCG7521352.1 hypothetical protein [Ruegeria sp. Ofav3-42]
MRIGFTSFLAAVLLAGNAIAETKVYDCAVNSREDSGWIAEHYIFTLDDATKQSTAESRHHDAAPVEMKIDRKQRYKLTWRANLSGLSGRHYNMVYRATLNPAQNTVKIYAKFTNASLGNRPSGSGTCKVISG